MFALRWVDVKKAGYTHRPWLWAKDLKMYNAPGSFAATRRIESLKGILRRAAGYPN